MTADFRFWQLFVNILSAVYCHQSAFCWYFFSCSFQAVSCLFTFYQLFIVITLMFVYILIVVYCLLFATSYQLFVYILSALDFVDFWRKTYVNVARFARNVVKWDFLGHFQTLCNLCKLQQKMTLDMLSFWIKNIYLEV